MQYTNLIQILENRCILVNKGITFINGSDREEFLSYKELYDAALQALFFLQQSGLNPKDQLILQLDDNRGFLVVFWACILGGIIPVPLTTGANDDHKKKLFNVWSVLDKPFLISHQSDFQKLGTFSKSNDLDQAYSAMGNRILIAKDVLASPGGRGHIYQCAGDDIAFIQFSSGSTGNPKGVVLTHKNLIANMEAISKAADYTDTDSMISWMPLTHDMGMIGFHLNPLSCGMNQFQIPTSLYIRRPSLWLEKVSTYKINILCSPNFGYKYFTKYYNSTDALNWDFSHVRIIYNGAEPVSETICYDFLRLLQKHGLRQQAMCPVYGLAEASLAVSISGMEDNIETIHVNREQSNYGDHIAAQLPGEHAVCFVNVGKPVRHCSVRITDDLDNAFPDEVIGHVQIKGINVTSGYYNNEAETQKAITQDGWFRTGDLGFFSQGSLYITGRAKDIIFINGQNYYPHDLEKIAEEVKGIELNKIAFAGFYNHEAQREEVMAFVFYRGGMADFIPLTQIVKAHINAKIGLEIHRVIPVKDIPRTTSGKLQRFKLLEQYRNGNFNNAELVLNQLQEEESLKKTDEAKPENEREQKLLECWKKIMQQDNIGVFDRFFEIGGDSLKAAELAMMVLKEFEVQLPAELLYQKQTIRELAHEIPLLAERKYDPVPVAPKQDYYPLSLSQKRLYYFWEVNKYSVAYNTPVAIAIHGALQIEKLEQIIQQLILRHDSLRMTFHLFAEPRIRIHDSFLFRLPCQSCEKEALKTTLTGLVQAFDLSQGPLFRFKLLEINSNEHILFADFHHIISDGISIYQFINEGMRIYAGKELPFLPIGYKDFVGWEKDAIQPEKMQQQELYWMSRLSGDLPFLELPYDFQRPPVFETSGMKLAFELGVETTKKLRSFAGSNECTLHVLLFTIYNLLLQKYSGQNDMIIGIPVSGRRHPDLQNLHGMFVNNVAIRCTIKGDERFEELLEAQKNNINSALAHQDFPFDNLVQAIGAKSDAGRNPLFDTMFVYQHMEFSLLPDEGLIIERYFFDPGFSKFDISMEVFEADHSIQYYIEYADKLFRQETILNLASHFEHLINCILLRPDISISELSIITNTEYDQYINRFNATAVTYPKEKNIHQLFAEQAFKTPNDIAIQYDDQQLTYKQLDEQSTRLSVLLKKSGVSVGRIAAILLPRSTELIISILGVLKTGAAYLPVDTGLPAERIKTMLLHSQCKVLITDQAHKTAMADYQIQNLVTTFDFKELDMATGENNITTENTNAGGNLAYIIYTSGTSGTPKGVMIEHSSLVNYITWAAAEYVKGEKYAFPLFTSVSFDLTITSIFTPLITGGKIIIYKDDEKDILVERIIADNKVDIIKLTPSHLRIINTASSLSGLSKSRIKKMIIGGEALKTKLAKEIYDKWEGNIELFNEYGPTEATVGCMIHTFNPGDNSLAVPIGIPAANTKIYLLDRFLNPVPAGVKGELYIGGDGVARGYMFEEEMTAQKFITDPFVPGKKMYKTGDMARRLPDGTIEYIGRTDQQVKINGYRIELSEIEHQLMQHDSVAGALVTVKSIKNDKQVLCAYYISEQELPESMLRSFLANKLPYYMIPAHFIRIAHMPLTNNGKINYRALPDINKKEKEIKLPANKCEQLTLKIWHDVFAGKDLTITDNFYELGGDSIKAVQIASRLFQEGISVKVKDILTYQTIEQISLHAELLGTTGRYQGMVTGERVLTPIERWFFDQRVTNPDFYNQSVLLQLNERINVEWLEKAFKTLITHHDGLRLNYDPLKNTMFYNGYWEQDFSIEVLIWEDEKGGINEPGSHPFSVVCYPFSQLKSGFNITSDLLIKPVLLKNKNGAQFLFITAHHLIMDGVSWRILLEDLYTIYQALKNGKSIQLAHKTADSIEWKEKLAAYADTEGMRQELAYWRSVENIDFSIPMDFEDPDWATWNLNKISKKLNKEHTGFLLKSHRVYRTDVSILLNIALAQTLKQWTGSNCFVIEQENHGRHLQAVDVSRTTGWFTCMYPAKIELNPAVSLGDQIKSVKEQLRSIPDHGMAYGILKYQKNSFRNKPDWLTEIRFNYLGQFDTELNNDLFSYNYTCTGSETDPANLMTARLEVNAMVMNSELMVEVSYNETAHKASTIHWFVENVLNNLLYILEHIKAEQDVHFTPSDFGLTNLNQEELDALF